MDDSLDQVATGIPERKLRIAGRPRPGCTETYVLCEEPGDVVQMHYRGKKVPHYKHRCPHCPPSDDVKPYWYVGAITRGGEPVIVELTHTCYLTLEAAARSLTPRGPTTIAAVVLSQLDNRKPVFRGLLVHMGLNRRFWLRCEQRVEVANEWAFHTRRELARIFEVPVRPRLFNQEQA